VDVGRREPVRATRAATVAAVDIAGRLKVRREGTATPGKTGTPSPSAGRPAS
jgi:hypothetical protein